MSALTVVWIKIRDRSGDCISRKDHKHEDLSSNPQHQQKKKKNKSSVAVGTHKPRNVGVDTRSLLRLAGYQLCLGSLRQLLSKK